jgi:hypothetical protein
VVADRELGRVHAHRESSRAGIEVVPGERALASLVDGAIGGEGERMGRDDLARQEVCAQRDHSEAPVAPLEARGLA